MELIIFVVFIIIGALIIENVYTKGLDEKLLVNIDFDNNYVNYGENTSLTVKIINKSRRFVPIIMMNIYFYRNGEYLEQKKMMFSLLKKQMVTRKFALGFDKRGFYEIKEIEIIYRGLFLKKEFKKMLSCKSTLTIYPKIQDVSDIELPFHKLVGDNTSDIRINEDIFKFCGMRKYYPEDSLSKINWKASAASGELISNMYEDSKDISISMLVIFPDEKTFFADSIIEKEISLVAGIYDYYLRNNVKISLVTNAVDCITSNEISFSTYNNVSQLNIIMESLARISTKKLKQKIEFKDVTNEDTLLIVKSALENRLDVKTDIDRYKNAGFDVFFVDIDG